MHSLRTRLDPRSIRLLAIVAAAPLLHCGGRSEDDGGGTGALRAAGASGGAGAVSGPPVGFCVNSSPLDPARYTGSEQCEGFKHRPESVECQSLLPRATDWTPGARLLVRRIQTARRGTYGYCTWSSDFITRACAYGCTTDAECGENSVCMCGAFIGTCMISSCKTDAECGDGLLCASYPNEFWQ